ncbi:hypothetical protein D3C72_615670 [compost metagenome]
MSRTLVICLALLVAATPLSAEVYKCTVNGNITFSDIPCTGDSEPVRMNIFTPSPEEVERANKRTRDIEENLASGRKQRQLEALRTGMVARDQKIPPEIAGERNEQRATTETSDLEDRVRAPGMQGVARQYQNEMEALNKQISTLQQKK